MSRSFAVFAVFAVLLCALVTIAFSCPPGEDCPICGRNAINVNGHVHPLAMVNCQNLNETTGTAATSAEQEVHSRQHCHCISGHVFKEGHTGDCVKPENCPKRSM
ncbi:hypothetical protein TYRP_015244 [Tyrophagus putrescentiae]|nr:hypothetical protein TYRP_015244 [Tyrophagus putrescentiae]